jgi:hypothetical protein
MSSFTVILSAGLAAGLLLTVRPAAAQEETSFKLAGTDTYIRHQNSQGVLSKIGSMTTLPARTRRSGFSSD